MGTVIVTELGKGIVRLALSNPTARNAMTEAMAADFGAAVAALEGRQDLRVVILSGEGEHFSGGGDLTWLESKTKLTKAENEKRMLEFYGSFLAIQKLRVPIIASIDGSCVGASLCLACAASIRVASDRAKFGLTFVKLGLHPGMGGSFLVPQVVGQGVAADLLLTGRILDSTEALRVGLVSQVFPAAELQAKSLELAQAIVAAGPVVTSELLETLKNPPKTLSEALTREAKLQAGNYAGKEFAEGIRAAIEKRKPSWT